MNDAVATEAVGKAIRALVATDGSPQSVAAARRAAELFGPDTQIVLTVVVLEKEDPEADAGGFEGPILTEESAEEMWQERRAEAADELARTAAAISGSPETHIVPSSADPGHVLVELAEKYAVDVLVVGASHKGAIRRFFAGSTSDYLVHHAHCPVLVVRDDHVGG